MINDELHQLVTDFIELHQYCKKCQGHGTVCTDAVFECYEKCDLCKGTGKRAPTDEERRLFVLLTARMEPDKELVFLRQRVTDLLVHNSELTERARKAESTSVGAVKEPVLEESFKQFWSAQPKEAVRVTLANIRKMQEHHESVVHAKRRDLVEAYRTSLYNRLAIAFLEALLK